MKKRIIALSLITVMVVCNSMTVWAADTWKGANQYIKGTTGTDNADRVSGNSGEKDATATFGITNTSGTMYSVDIQWGSLEYTPTGTLNGTWQDALGHYSVTGHTGWNVAAGADKITVINKSNVNITASFEAELDTNFKTNYFTNSLTPSLSLTDTSQQVKSANNLVGAETTTYVNTLSISGIIDKAPNAQPENTKVTLGTVTITIAAS